MLTLAELIRGIAGGEAPIEGISVAFAAPISSTVIDSRHVLPGSLFFALRGEHRTGYDFIPDAVARGAVAVVAEKQPPDSLCLALDIRQPLFEGIDLSKPVCIVVPDALAALHRAAAYWRRQHAIRTIGVTGSVGKTTVKELIAAVLRQRYATLKTEGNYNNEIGLPLTLLRLAAAHERMVLEMGMYDLGEIASLADMAQPHVGVITNVGPTHLERLGTIERVAQAKAELCQALPPADEGGIAILNADDEWVTAMKSQTKARIMTYGLADGADLRADDIESRGLEGIHFSFCHGHERVRARVPMLGRHSVHAALSAAAVGLVEGLSWDEILSGLSDQSAQLRLVAVPGVGGSTILDDSYNASPASSIAALNLLRELGGRKLAVLGDMYELGSYEQAGHRLVGRRARDAADLLVAVGRLGRLIGEEALESGMPPHAVRFADGNAAAVDQVRGLLQPGDVVLIKGSRGARMEEIVSELTHRPSDPACGEKAR